MTELRARTVTVVCLATYFKGIDFIRECKRQGCSVILITKEKLLGEDWPRESLDDLIGVPDDATPDVFIHVVSQQARRRIIDRIIALEEFDVLTAALIREHLCDRTGMTATTARLFRDKLAMRIEARAAAIAVPEFIALLNEREIDDYMKRVPPPWVIKPRSDVSAIGIRKASAPEQIWRVFEELDQREALREKPSYYLLERFIPGSVYHVDSLVKRGEVIFAGVNIYGRPPLDVAQQGGVSVSHTLPHDSPDAGHLLEMNRRVVRALGLKHGAAHAEFIKSSSDGRFYFLEIAARVGGAFIAEALEAASGVNLWCEWAKIELMYDTSIVPHGRKDYAGIVLSLARQEYPDTTSRYTDPEIVYRVNKRHHVGLIVSSPRLERITELLDEYSYRFKDDFCAIVPPPERVG